MIYACIIIIIIYSITIFWIASGIAKNKTIINDTFMPEVSIIVSARNEEKNIINLLESLINQTYKSNYEIIIANDRSNDSTSKIISKYCEKFKFIQLIDIKETPIGWGNKKWALNNCIDKTKHDIILQTDADCIPRPKWIEAMVNEFADSSVIFVSGPGPLINHKNPFNNYYKLDSLAQDALSAGGMTHNMVFSCTGRNMGFLKKTFHDIKGYETIEHYISGDDDLLIQKFASLSKGKIVFSFNPNSIVESPPPNSIKSFLHQRIRYASKGFDYYRLNTSNELKILLPFLYISNLVCLLSLIAFIKDSRILYLIPLLLKSISDYWICYVFSNKINERFELKTFIGLTIIHPIYISLLGIISPLINYQWKNDV